MKRERRLDYLLSLREETAGLCVIKCHMSHERVIRATGSMLPVVSKFPAGSYQRIGLCNPETRAQRLGCSHTSARIKLGTAIEELSNDGNDSDGMVALLDRELNDLDNEIHLLDHRKGEAEKVLARILEELHRATDPAGLNEKLTAAEREVQDMERLHDEFVDRIGLLRDRVIAEIDKLVQQLGNNGKY